MRKLILTMLERKFPLEAVLNMTVDEAYDYMDAWSKMTQPEKPKKCLVKRR
jgi:hypothetical protein